MQPFQTLTGLYLGEKNRQGQSYAGGGACRLFAFQKVVCVSMSMLCFFFVLISISVCILTLRVLYEIYLEAVKPINRLSLSLSLSLFAVTAVHRSNEMKLTLNGMLRVILFAQHNLRTCHPCCYNPCVKCTRLN